MGRQAIELIEELRTFWYVGHIWRSRQVNQMTYGQLEALLWTEFKLQMSGNTIRKRLRRLAEFLTEYYVSHHARARTSLDFLDFVQGRPPEMLADGWVAWEEVNRYFEHIGATLT